MITNNELDPERMRHELENIYMLARVKRAKRHRYDNDGKFIGLIGPKSDDEDWDKVIKFCEQAGLRATIIRTMEAREEVERGRN